MDIVIVADRERISLGVALNMIIAQKTCPAARFNVAIPKSGGIGSKLAESVIMQFASKVYEISDPTLIVEDRTYSIENKINALREFEEVPAILSDSDMIFLRPLPFEFLNRAVPTAVPEHGKHPFPWKELYRRFDLPFPQALVISASGEVGEPWLNAGFVACPNAAQLGATWLMIANAVNRCDWVPERWPYVDQISLPLAMSWLSPERCFTYASILPPQFNQNVFYWAEDQAHVKAGFVLHHHNRVKLIRRYIPHIISWIRESYPIVDQVLLEMEKFDDDK